MQLGERSADVESDAHAVGLAGLEGHEELGVVVAGYLYCRARKLPKAAFADVLFCAAPIGLCLGRIANFINAELAGRVTDRPWGMLFPDPPWGPLPRHPSQLYEAFAEGLLLFVLVNLLVRWGGFKRPGFVAGAFGMGYAVARIACEFFREPDPQLGFLFGTSVDALSGGITMGMLLSLPVFFAGLWLVLRSKREAPGEARA